MTTLKQVKQEIAADQKNWFIYLMDFVDDFRRRRDPRMIEEPFELSDERFDALYAQGVRAGEFSFACLKTVVVPRLDVA